MVFLRVAHGDVTKGSAEMPVDSDKEIVDMNSSPTVNLPQAVFGVSGLRLGAGAQFFPKKINQFKVSHG